MSKQAKRARLLPEYDASDFTSSKNRDDFLGHGGFASVRKCWHKERGDVVVKCFIIPGSKKEYDRAMLDVSREMIILNRIDHINIVRTYGITKWSNCIGIVMEFMKGGSLEDLLKAEEVANIPWELRLRINKEIAEAVLYLHCADVKNVYIHGDLKPQNILLTFELTAKVADFGSTNIVQATGAPKSSVEVSKSTQHTPTYSAPELLKNPLMERTSSMDIYSLSMVGYEIITRHSVFIAPRVNIHVVIMRITSRDGLTPDMTYLDEVEKSLQTQKQNLEIFRFLKNLMMKCWSKNPGDRPHIRKVQRMLKNEFNKISNSNVLQAVERVKRQLFGQNHAKLNKFRFPFEEASCPSEVPEVHLPMEVILTNHSSSSSLSNASAEQLQTSIRSDSDTTDVTTPPEHRSAQEQESRPRSDEPSPSIPPHEESKHEENEEPIKMNSKSNSNRQTSQNATSHLLSIGGWQGGAEIGRTVSDVKIIFPQNKEKLSKRFPNLPIERCCSCSFLFHDHIYDVGGNTTGKWGTARDELYRMKINTNPMKWEEMSPLLEKRCEMGCAVLGDLIYIVGGLNEKGEVLPSGELFSPTDNVWVSLPPVNKERYGNQLVACKGKLYAIGGRDGSLNYLNSVETLQPGDDVWCYVTPMKDERAWFAAVLLHDVIYVIGGYNGAGKLKTCEKYNIKEKKWSHIKSMNIERIYCSACVLQDKIYVSGGLDKKNKLIKTIECYNPSTNEWDEVGETEQELSSYSLVAI